MAGKVKPVQSSKPQKTVRNVLVQPFKVRWPCVELAEGRNLVNLLNQIPKDHVVHGTNPISQLLSKGLASALLISSDFHPQIFGKQIIQMARRNSPEIQILALDSLSWNGKPEKMVAIRNTSDKCSEKVAEMLTLMMDISKSKGYDAESSKFSSNRNLKPLEKRVKLNNFSEEDLEKLYLSRPTMGLRAFVPPVSKFCAIKPTDTTKRDWGQFISLKRPRSEPTGSYSKCESLAATKACIDTLEQYVPLTVNRVQGNPNRKAEKRRKK